MENKHQVFWQYTVKKSMKTKVIVYVTDRESDSRVIHALTEAGIRVKTVKNLTQMHILLTSQHFDAFIVTAEFMKLHGISPERYLRERHSTLSIICYSYTQNGTISLQTHQISETTSGIPDAPDRAEIVVKIETALIAHIDTQTETPTKKSSNTTTKQFKTQSSQHTAFLNEAGIHIHTKMRLILEALIQAGAQGIERQLLAEVIWGINGVDKKSDIQSYICKLKAFLEVNYKSKYRIERIKSQYFLIENAPQEAAQRVPL